MSEQSERQRAIDSNIETLWTHIDDLEYALEEAGRCLWGLWKIAQSLETGREDTLGYRSFPREGLEEDAPRTESPVREGADVLVLQQHVLGQGYNFGHCQGCFAISESLRKEET